MEQPQSRTYTYITEKANAFLTVLAGTTVEQILVTLHMNSILYHDSKLNPTAEEKKYIMENIKQAAVSYMPKHDMIRLIIPKDKPDGIITMFLKSHESKEDIRTELMVLQSKYNYLEKQVELIALGMYVNYGKPVDAVPTYQAAKKYRDDDEVQLIAGTTKRKKRKERDAQAIQDIQAARKEREDNVAESAAKSSAIQPLSTISGDVQSPITSTNKPNEAEISIAEFMASQK